ncbi:MAG: hypothetical protein IPG76_01810 [Acidobacteria bacterium]|nr:hypothetical protein [Acidobacteriota bacterium]
MTNKEEKAHTHKHENGHHHAETEDSTKNAEFAKTVVNHLVDAQKKWIELTSQQNAMMVKAIEDGMGFYRSAPNPILGDWARQAVEGFVEAQKRWSEIATQQSRQMYESSARRSILQSHGNDEDDVRICRTRPRNRHQSPGTVAR